MVQQQNQHQHNLESMTQALNSQVQLDEETLISFVRHAHGFSESPGYADFMEQLVAYPGHTGRSLWELTFHIQGTEGLAERIIDHPNCSPEVKTFVNLFGKLS